VNVKLKVMIGSGLVSTLLAIGCASNPANLSQEKAVPAIDASAGAGLAGYDAVAYFTDHKPVRGSDAYTRQWQGVTWKFGSAEHRDVFAADPERYAPQYGGYCAYAVANGTTAHGDPLQWAVVNERLFVNNNALAKLLWDRDRPGNIKAGDENWPLIPKYLNRLQSADTSSGGRTGSR
jgi:hypothetical protein